MSVISAPTDDNIFKTHTKNTLFKAHPAIKRKQVFLSNWWKCTWHFFVFALSFNGNGRMFVLWNFI